MALRFKELEMEKQEVNSKKYYTIDVLHILKYLWKNVWIILLAAAIAAGAGFCYAEFLVDDIYSSTILLYVNNKSISLGNASFSISSSEITAAQSLVKTYGVILNNRTTLERIKDTVDDNTSREYSIKELSEMIESGSTNDTEIMYVKVTSNNAEDAALIADCITDILPERIDDIIEGATMKPVDYAVVDDKADGPSVMKYTAIALMIGAVISMVVISIISMFDDRIHDEEYIIQTYEYPILAKIPNLINVDGKKHGYYYETRSKDEANVSDKN